MRIDIYLGPSLRPSERDPLVAEIPADVRVRPPIRQGDLIRSYRRLPDVILILDGVFFQTPSVYHKEILAAMDAGAVVLGGSSMGALRAAELDTFGMIGVGKVYQLYRSGAIDGDEMVALAHGDADTDYQPLSVPLVNIRETLRQAARSKVVEQRLARAVLRSAGKLFFPHRTWSSVLGQAKMDGAAPGELAALRGYVDTSAADLKREDAITALRLVADRVRAGAWPRPRPARQATARTTYFAVLLAEYDSYQIDGQDVGSRQAINLLRLLDDEFPALAGVVNQRCAALDEAAARGLTPADPEQLLAQYPPWSDAPDEDARADLLRARHLTREELVAGLAERELEARLHASIAAHGAAPVETVLASVSQRTGLRRAELGHRLLAHPGVPWDGPLIRELKLRGDFGRVLSLAARITALNESFDQRHPSVRARLTDTGLREWFARRWQVPLAELATPLRQRCFQDNTEFLETARLGYVYDWLRSKK